jgi:hypothetical protein
VKPVSYDWLFYFPEKEKSCLGVPGACRGVGLKMLWLDAFFLLLFAFIMVTLASRKFQKKVK